MKNKKANHRNSYIVIWIKYLHAKSKQLWAKLEREKTPLSHVCLFTLLCRNWMWNYTDVKGKLYNYIYWQNKGRITTLGYINNSYGLLNREQIYLSFLLKSMRKVNSQVYTQIYYKELCQGFCYHLRFMKHWRLTFLHFRMDCNHGDNKTKHKVQADEELVCLAAWWLKTEIEAEH